MTLEELIDALQEIVERERDDPEDNHYDADQLLLKYIGDAQVEAVYDQIEKWYA